MLSRNDHDTSYSKILGECTPDEEAQGNIAAAAATAEEFDDDWLNDLVLTVETDEEILSGIDDIVIDDEEAIAASSEVTKALSSEVTTPAVVRSSKVTASPAKSPSSKVTTRFRKSLTNDRHTIGKIQDFANSLVAPIAPPLVAILTPSKTTPLNPLKANPKPSNDNSIGVWEKGDDLLKLTMANEVLEVSGTRAVSWTLDLTPDKIKSALSHPSGFTGSLADDLNRALERELGRKPSVWFHGDISKAGNLHLHGAIDADSQDEAGVERALRHVGGHGPKGGKADKMVHMNPQRCEQGWVIYACRNRGAVRKVLGEKASLYTITRPLRLEAADFYFWLRKVMRSA